MKNGWLLPVCGAILAGSLWLHRAGQVEFGSGLQEAVQAAGRVVCGTGSWNEAVQVFGRSVTGAEAVAVFGGTK
ncbi:MAG: hypothetical protein ACI4PQ_02075 [Butyricicoccaceae bacterium]